MMVFVLVVLIGVTIVQVYLLIKRGEKKEAILYMVFAVLTFAFGVYLTLVTTHNCLSALMFRLLGVKP